MTGSAFVLLIGDELLAGRTVDENGVWLVRHLTARGVRVMGLQTVSDEPADIERALLEAAGRADLVVVSGGLGPTDDDRTRQALAAAAGVPLQRDEAAYQALEQRLARRGRSLAPREERQASLPAGAVALDNPVGIAPGIRLELAGATVVVLPGVPREWRAMCESHVLDALAHGEHDTGERALWVAGLPESVIAAKLEPALRGMDIDVGSYPHEGEVELRLRGQGSDVTSRIRAAEAAEAAIRQVLGVRVYDPPPGGRIEHVVVRALKARRWRVATAESITGGLLARLLTRVPGASDVFPVGWVTYETSQKTARLGVPKALIDEFGVVSAAVAGAMAEGARGKAGVEAALATTGTAGPGPLLAPDRDPVPPGRVYVALALEGRETEVLELLLPTERELAQRFAAVCALDLLRRRLPLLADRA